MTEEKPSMEELERMFDEGVDVAQYADYSDRPGLRQRRVGVDMPLAMIDRLDARASAAGVTRQALIKSWLAERLALEDRLAALAHLGMPRPAPRPPPKAETRRRASPTPRPHLSPTASRQPRSTRGAERPARPRGRAPRRWP